MHRIKERSFQFIDIASAESDALHRYCNAMARISHVVTPRNHPFLSPTQSMHVFLGQELENIDLRTALAERHLSQRGLHPYPSFNNSDSRLHRGNDYLHDAMEEYYDALEALRTCHSLLTHFISEQSALDKALEHDVSILEKPVLSWMMDHLDLSCRVLTTCSSSSTSIGFGPFYENGLLKDLNGNDDSMNKSWHQVRIVSLAALQSNITRIKRNLVDMFGDK